jgi:branched-subunit amino acid transport protein
MQTPHMWLKILSRLLFGLAVAWVTPLIVLAQADQTKGLSPRVARVLRWLPEDTETLLVSQSVTLPSPDEAHDWQNAALGSSSVASDSKNLTYD